MRLLCVLIDRNRDRLHVSGSSGPHVRPAGAARQCIEPRRTVSLVVSFQLLAHYQLLPPSIRAFVGPPSSCLSRSRSTQARLSSLASPSTAALLMPSRLSALKLQDLAALAPNLGAHKLDFRTNVVQPHTAPPHFNQDEWYKTRTRRQGAKISASTAQLPKEQHRIAGIGKRWQHHLGISMACEARCPISASAKH